MAAAVTELAKSVLIDVELRRYSQSSVAFGLWAVALDILLDDCRPWDNLERSDAIIEVWEQLVLEMFGEGAMAKIERFGWFLFWRQKCIFQAYGKMPDCINKIYTDKSCAIFESKCVEEQFDMADFATEDVFARNKRLDEEYEVTINWVVNK